MTHSPLHVQDLPDEILSPDEDAETRAKIAHAEEDLSARFDDETRANVG